METEPSHRDALQRLKAWIDRADKILLFTGAGISTESGISDYRSKGGLWQRFQPVTIQEFQADHDKRVEYWQRKCELYVSLQTARPNLGHDAITRLSQSGRMLGLITQNIDGLHQVSGVQQEKILELHGSNRTTICLTCSDLTGWEETFQRLQDGEEVPICHKCGGFLKPNTISFGQSLNPQVLEASIVWSNECDLFIAVGSTLLVEPAASLPRIALRNGTCLVILTKSDTPLDSLADLKLEGAAGDILSALI